MKTLAITLTLLFAFATTSAITSVAKPAGKVESNMKEKEAVRAAQSAYE
ncbi:MAG: hypothetical protein Q8L53_00195 [Aestuariivirga sp.]|nr:hypothetical protein [Aestuariivirga sp.]